MFFRRKKRSVRSPSRFSKPTVRRTLPKRRFLTRRKPGRTLVPAATSPTPAASAARRQGNRGIRGLISRTKRSFVLILTGAMTLAIVHTLFLSDTLTVTSIQVNEDGETAPRHPIQILLQEFEGSNLLLLDTGEVEGYLKKLYPEYETLKISKKLPDTLTVTLEKFGNVANFIVQNSEGDEVLFVLNTGGRVTAAESEAENPDLPTLRLETDEPILTGSAVITQEHLAFILEAVQNYEDKFGMQILYAQYFPIEREAHLWTELEFYVWLDLSQNLDEQLNKLKKALPRLDIYEIPLDYIDLRISGVNGEKIIYRLR